MIVAKIALLAACLFLVLIAWEDFQKFKVRNRSVLILLVLYLVFTAARGELSPIVLDLTGGGLLFVLGFVFWMLGMMGAGDAKLFFPVGCWVSLPNLASWALLLLLASVVLWLLVRLPMPVAVRHLAVFSRLDELRQGKQVPYAVPIALATIVTLLPNIFL